MGLTENNGLSVADVMALSNNSGVRNDCYGNSGGMFGGQIWVFFIFFLLAFGGGGFGFGGNNGNLNNALNQQDLFRNQANLMSEVGAFERDATNNWGDMKYDNLIGVNNILNALNDNRFASQQCCCETNRNIDALRYENAKNTCDIMHNDTLNTRDVLEAQNAGFQRILDFMTNDKIDSLRSELQSAQLQLSNMSQTGHLINTLRPYPQPAYITCSPYTTNNGCCCG